MGEAPFTLISCVFCEHLAFDKVSQELLVLSESNFRQVLDQKGLNVVCKCARTAVKKEFTIATLYGEHGQKVFQGICVLKKELMYLWLLQLRQVDHKKNCKGNII